MTVEDKNVVKHRMTNNDYNYNINNTYNDENNETCYYNNYDY